MGPSQERLNLHAPRGMRDEPHRVLRVRASERFDLGLRERPPEPLGAAELAVGVLELLADEREIEVAVVDAVDVEPGVRAQEGRGARRGGRRGTAIAVTGAARGPGGARRPGGTRATVAPCAGGEGEEPPPALGEAGVGLDESAELRGGPGERAFGVEEARQRDRRGAVLGERDPRAGARREVRGEAGGDCGPRGARRGDLAADGRLELAEGVRDEHEVGALDAQRGGARFVAAAPREREEAAGRERGYRGPRSSARDPAAGGARSCGRRGGVCAWWARPYAESRSTMKISGELGGIFGGEPALP